MNIREFIKTRGLTKYLILGFAILVTALILQKFFLIFMLMILSLIISFFIGMFQMSKSIGIELVTFTTILAGFAFGPSWGIAIGLVLIILHFTLGHFAAGPYVLWVVPSYALIGFLAGTITGLDFVTMGVYMTIGLNAFNLFATITTYSQNLGNYLPFSITNILFNLILFNQIGPIIAVLVK